MCKELYCRYLILYTMDIIRLIYYFISLSSKKEQENVF